MNKKIQERRTILSTLWIFLTVNYIYCDIISHMEAGVLKDLLEGSAGGLNLTPGFLLGAGILMEIPMAMILLSRILKRKINRWFNIVAAIIMTAAQSGSLFVGEGVDPHYIFFSVIEIACCLFIIVFAWRWKADKTA